jgi:hypothetical protein
MHAFIHSLRVNADNFRSEVLRKTCEFEKVEREYREIKRRTDPLVQSLNMPERDPSGKRAQRLKNRDSDHPQKLIVRKTPNPGATSPRATNPTLVTVLPFQSEQFTAFHTHSRVRAGSVRRKPDLRRFVEVKITPQTLRN